MDYIENTCDSCQTIDSASCPRNTALHGFGALALNHRILLKVNQNLHPNLRKIIFKSEIDLNSQYFIPNITEWALIQVLLQLWKSSQQWTFFCQSIFSPTVSLSFCLKKNRYAFTNIQIYTSHHYRIFNEFFKCWINSYRI